MVVGCGGVWGDVGVEKEGGGEREGEEEEGEGGQGVSGEEEHKEGFCSDCVQLLVWL